MGRFRRIAFFIITSLFLSSCLNSGGGKDCDKNFDKTVEPDQIVDHSRLLISMDKLDFLFANGQVVLDDVELETNLNGHIKGSNDLRLAMNGTKLSRYDGRPYCDSLDYDGPSNQSHGTFKLQKLSLNGGLPFDLFLSRLKKQGGRLEISVIGKLVDLSKAHVHFKGKIQSCPSDPGNSNPQPKPAAKTTLNSVDPAQSPTASTSVSFSFSADQTGVSFMCSLDGAAFALCASPQSYAGLASGSHTFQVYSHNSSGVDETPAISYSWTVDATAPTVTITNLASLPTLTDLSQMSFEFSSNETATFKCSLDDAAFAACTSGTTYSALSEGPHKFAVQAIDSVGNVSGQPATFNWTVDQTAPVTSIDRVDPFAAVSNQDHRTFEFSANESANFECSVDNGPFASCQSPVALTSLSEGSHWFEVRATDLAGNVGASASAAWKNDFTAPTITLGTVTPPVGLTNAKSIAVEFAADEPVTFSCSQDGAAAQECLSPLKWDNVADGNHELDILATDVAGNQSVVTSLTWQVDSTAPVLTFANIEPTAATYVNSPNMIFAFNLSENASLHVQVNGADVTSPSNPLDLNGLADGAYELSAQAIDAAGNASPLLTHDFVIDTVAPTLAITSDDSRDPSPLDHRTLTFVASEAVTYQCNVDNTGFADCVSPLALSGLADGNHAVVVTASDLAGNTATQTLQWTVDTQAPTTTLSISQTDANMTATFSADETATFTCSLDGATEASCTSPVSYSDLQPGAHSFQVWATDAAGNREASGPSQSFEVILPLVTTITSASPGPGLSNQRSASFSFTANQKTSDFQCSLDGAAAVSCASPATYSGLADGAHTFVVKAVDLQGHVDAVGATSSWSIDATAPVINGISLSTTTNSITITWTTSEPSTEQLRYGVGFTITQQTAESTTYSTTHSIKLSGLSSNTTYSFQVYGRDQAGNAVLSPSQSVRTSR